MRSLISLCLALAACAAQAQALPGGAQLGMTPQQLQQAVPALERVARPARMAGGLVGSWRGPAVEAAGVLLAPTFFFTNDELQRVEYLATARPGTDAFAALRAWGRGQWGAELASQEQEGSYATWTAGDADAYLQQAATVPRTVRLVLKRRVQKEAGEL